MRRKSGLPSPASDYLTKPPTKAPSWHGLVVFDVWFNNLTAGLFLVAALSQLIAPEPFSNVTRVAFPLAFLLLIVDLVLLVLDLGDPWRFHHMLRVFKPSSPMSLGTWCLTAYSLPLAIAALLALLGIQPGWFEALVLITGILPALGTAIYKGVLFSTSSQPGWKDARWLGSYLTSSAFLLGSALFVVLAIWMKQDRAIEILRPTLVGLLLLNGVTIGLLLAIKQYEEILQNHPHRLDAANNLAWLLATDPSTAARRSEAVALAKETCRQTQDRHPAFLDTLAMALANSGDQAAAVDVLRRAIPVAQGRGEIDLARKMRDRLTSYQ